MNETYICDYCKRELTEETGHYTTVQNQHPFYIDLCSGCAVTHYEKYVKNEVSDED